MSVIAELPPITETELEELARFVGRSRRTAVLTGAGCSTESGIPDYRGPEGTWHRRRPMQYGEFVRSEPARRYYWARNYRGWPLFDAASPNVTHHALARLEAMRLLSVVITQNVDPLHRRAGSRNLIELHGQSDRVMCLDCGIRSPRVALQERMTELNRGWLTQAAGVNPDGDAEIDRELTVDFVVPPCESCGGTLKPDVVFFGENVPAGTVNAAMQAVDRSDALLVVGSSLAVWSGFRFARRARERGIPIAILNWGPTRADELADLRIQARCGQALQRLVARFEMSGTTHGGEVRELDVR